MSLRRRGLLRSRTDVNAAAVGLAAPAGCVSRCIDVHLLSLSVRPLLQTRTVQRLQRTRRAMRLGHLRGCYAVLRVLTQLPHARPCRPAQVALLLRCAWKPAAATRATHQASMPPSPTIAATTRLIPPSVGSVVAESRARYNVTPLLNRTWPPPPLPRAPPGRPPCAPASARFGALCCSSTPPCMRRSA
jgi:hypothetical protein